MFEIYANSDLGNDARTKEIDVTRLRPSDAERRTQRGAGPDFSEALARGLQVLTLFNAEHPAITLSDLARAANLPRATVRRVMLTLVYLGYVQADGRLFRLTPRVLRLAAAYLTSNAVSTLLQPACDRVTRLVGESCTAAVLEGPDVVMIARALPMQLVPAGVGIGYRLPAYCSALGRILLTALPPAALDAYLSGVPLVPLTDRTVVEPVAIGAAIRAAATDGFCFVDQEAEYGFRSIAVPLRKFDGTVVAALNIGARIERADVATLCGPYLAILRAEAEGLSGLLI